MLFSEAVIYVIDNIQRLCLVSIKPCTVYVKCIILLCKRLVGMTVLSNIQPHAKIELDSSKSYMDLFLPTPFRIAGDNS